MHCLDLFRTFPPRKHNQTRMVFQIIPYLPFHQKEKQCFRQMTPLFWQFWIPISESIQEHLCCCLLESNIKNLVIATYMERQGANGLGVFVVVAQLISRKHYLRFVSGLEHVPALPSCDNNSQNSRAEIHAVEEAWAPQYPTLFW